MASAQLHSVIAYIRRLATLSGDADFTDADLLSRFVAHRDEAAFEALLRRHGPTVLAVCRRILDNADDAVDKLLKDAEPAHVRDIR